MSHLTLLPQPAAPADPDAVPRREHVIAVLTDAILNHRLLPGQRLVEREIIEQLGVSRATVREAFRQLAADGLVQMQPQRGASVMSVSAQDAQALYDARAALEVLLVARFVECADQAAIDRLTVAVFDLGVVADTGSDAAAILEARTGFYAALSDGAGTPVITQLVDGLQARVRVLCASSLSELGRPRAAADELRAVVTAIRSRDADLASRLMVEHIAAAAAATIRTLS
jgi:DNA-binding GntR family transcriptional regulator